MTSWGTDANSITCPAVFLLTDTLSSNNILCRYRAFGLSNSSQTYPLISDKRCGVGDADGRYDEAPHDGHFPAHFFRSSGI